MVVGHFLRCGQIIKRLLSLLRVEMETELSSLRLTNVLNLIKVALDQYACYSIVYFNYISKEKQE